MKCKGEGQVGKRGQGHNMSLQAIAHITTHTHTAARSSWSHTTTVLVTLTLNPTHVSSKVCPHRQPPPHTTRSSQALPILACSPQASFSKRSAPCRSPLLPRRVGLVLHAIEQCYSCTLNNYVERKNTTVWVKYSFISRHCALHYKCNRSIKMRTKSKQLLLPAKVPAVPDRFSSELADLATYVSKQNYRP